MALSVASLVEGKVSYMTTKKTDDQQAYLTLLLRRAVSCMRRKRLKGALKLLRKVMAVDKRNAVAHYNAGFVYENLGRLRQAKNFYRRALRHKDTYVDAAVCLGYLCGLRGDFKRELIYYDRALRRDPGHKVALYNKAVAFDDGFKQPGQAMRLYRRVLQTHLSSRELHDVLVRMVYAYLDLGRYADARDILTRIARNRKTKRSKG